MIRGGAMTRLEGFRRALEATISGISKDLQGYADDRPRFDVFAYGFGLRHRTVGYADLFSLIKIGGDFADPEEIERLKRKHTEDVRRQYEAKASQYSGIGEIARQYLGSYVDQIERNYRKQAEDEVKNRVLAEIVDRVAARLRERLATRLWI